MGLDELSKLTRKNSTSLGTTALIYKKKKTRERWNILISTLTMHGILQLFSITEYFTCLGGPTNIYHKTLT